MATLIISAVLVVLSTVIVLVVSLVGSPAFIADFGSIYGEFLKFTSFGYRYWHFLMGDFARPFADALVTFLTLKYGVLPIVSVIRSVFAHGG